MRRSSSTSHIPTRQRSRSTARTSTREPSTGAVKSSAKLGARAASSDRLTIPKRSNSVASSDKRSIHTALFSRSSRAKATSSDIVTPASNASRSRSPRATSELKSLRQVNINDKRWVQEQYAKVRRFLQESGDFDETNMPDLKPPTINTFVRVTDLLFKLIDPQLTINNSTYKEKIIATLKKIQYPGSVTNSFLKTVNTMHEWPQVISLWAWLVDLITFIKQGGLPNNPALYDEQKHMTAQCILRFFCKRYVLYNREEDHAAVDEEFKRNFAEVLKVDPNETARLQRKVDDLSAIKSKELVDLAMRKKRNKEIEDEIKRLEDETDTFYMEDEMKERELEDMNQQLKERKAKAVESINRGKRKIHELKEQVKNQSCSYEEKTRLLGAIAQLKHTNTLKKGTLETMQKIKDDRDFKLVEATRLVETQIYRLNNNLLELKVMDPCLSDLELRTAGFAAPSFRDEIKDFHKNFVDKKNGNKDDCKKLSQLVSKVKSNVNSLEKQLQSAKENLDVLTVEETKLEAQIKKRDDDQNNMLKEAQLEIQSYAKKIKDLSNSEPDIEGAKLELRNLTEHCQKLEKEFDHTQVMGVKFFEDYADNGMKHLMAMNAIHTEIVTTVEQNAANVLAEQELMIKKLQDLEDITERENKK